MNNPPISFFEKNRWERLTLGLWSKITQNRKCKLFAIFDFDLKKDL